MTALQIQYPWYMPIGASSELDQGDLIDNYERVWDFDNETQEAIADTYNLIVMTQSCDIGKKSVSQVVLCPVLTFDEVELAWPDIKSPKNKEELRRGHVTNLHLLNSCDLPGLERPFRVVIFRRVLEVPKEDLTSFVADKHRIRLLPPYREHLAQAFARFFMRVGLPKDIPEFK